MNLNHPEVKDLINKWQKELREKTNNNVVLLTAFIPGTSKISLNELKQIICKYTGVSYENVLHRSKYGRQVLTRQLISFYAREHFGYSFSEIAADLKRKDHTTILKSIRKVKGYIETGDQAICDLMVKINLEMEKYQ